MEIQVVGAELVHVDGQTESRMDGRTKRQTDRKTQQFNGSFVQFCKRAEKLYLTSIILKLHLVPRSKHTASLM